jgi:hypothetical protein
MRRKQPTDDLQRQRTHPHANEKASKTKNLTSYLVLHIDLDVLANKRQNLTAEGPPLR